MKNVIKKILKRTGLLGTTKMLAYYLLGYDAANFRHKKKMVSFYSQFIRKGDFAFDVGASIGNRTEIFLKLGAKVVCVEPLQNSLSELYELFGRNRNVIIVNKALADREGFAELSICDDLAELSTMSEKWKREGRFSKNCRWTKVERVPTTTLDTLISIYGLPEFCKIDVEGYEETVLRGLTKPIPQLSFEFSREFFDDAKRCINRLLLIGRYKFNFSIEESMELLFPEWVTPGELYDKLNSFEDKLLWGDIYAKVEI